ncbi:MAG TPA: hypothetical protein VGM83_13915 [Devosiaceae bacterium]|jgi:hypothetical protein
MNALAEQPQPVSEAVDPALALQLQQLAEDLGAPRERIETAFVDVGGSLTQAAGILGRISSVFEALPRDLESQEMVEATSRLDAVGQRAEAIAASFSAEGEDIARLVSVVKAAEQPISDLRKAVKMMGIVAINARVVAAGIVGRLQDFDVFTTDIASLSESATTTIQDFSLVYGQLTDNVRKAAEQRSHFETSHKDTLTGLALRLRRNLDEVTRRRRESAAGSAETGRVSRQITGRIAAAVSALQVGDATRQRVEHVETGIIALRDLLSGREVAGKAGAIVLAQSDESVLLQAVSTLEVEQLADTGNTFTLEVTGADDALRQLAVDAKTIMEHSQHLYGQGSKQGQSPLAVLNADLREASHVLGDCETERGKLDQMAAAVAATVDILLGHVEAVQEIEANMRLVSLNAAVKCAQLGPRGKALDVIAQQLRQLTGETVLAAEAAMGNLKQAAELAQSFNRAAADDAAGQVGALEQEARASVALLETIDARMAEALVVLDRDGTQALKCLDRAAIGFSDHAAIADAMAEVQSRLGAFALTPWLAGTSPTGSVTGVLAHLRTTYTMGSERQIHDRLFGRAEPEPQPEVMTPAAEEDLDALFF